MKDTSLNLLKVFTFQTANETICGEMIFCFLSILTDFLRYKATERGDETEMSERTRVARGGGGPPKVSTIMAKMMFRRMVPTVKKKMITNTR